MIRVCALTDLPDGESTPVVAHVPVAVFNADGELFAIDDTCTHQDASLSEGWLEDCMIECPLHAASFDLRTGKPTVKNQDAYPVDTGTEEFSSDGRHGWLRVTPEKVVSWDFRKNPSLRS